MIWHSVQVKLQRANQLWPTVNAMDSHVPLLHAAPRRIPDSLTTSDLIKSKFGQRLRSKTLTAQLNEALCKVLCHDLCGVIQLVHELEVETSFSTEVAAA